MDSISKPDRPPAQRIHWKMQKTIGDSIDIYSIDRPEWVYLMDYDRVDASGIPYGNPAKAYSCSMNINHECTIEIIGDHISIKIPSLSAMKHVLVQAGWGVPSKRDTARIVDATVAWALITEHD